MKQIKKLTKIQIICLLISACLYSLTSYAAQKSRPIMEIFNEAMSLRSSNHQKSSMLYYQLRDRQNELPGEYKLELVYLEAYLQMMRGSYDRAIETHSNLTMVKDPNIALRSYSNMLTIELLRRDYLAASSYIIPMLEILETDSDDLKVRYSNYAYDIIGSLYSYLDDNHKGLFYLNKVEPNVYTDREKCNYNIQLMITKIGLGIETIDSINVQQAKEQCIYAGETIMLQGFIADIGYKLLKDEQYLQVIKLLSPYLKDVEQAKFAMGTAEFFSYLAKSYHEIEQIEKAESLAQKAIIYAKDLPEPEPYKLALEVLYQQSLNRPNPQASFDLLKDLLTTNEAQNKIEHLKLLGLAQAEVDFKELTTSIQKYNAQVHLDNKIKDKKTKANKIFSLYVFFERMIHIALLLTALYQIRLLFKELKLIKHENLKVSTDKVTKTLTRHAFIKKSTDILEQFQSNNACVALILFNIDKFRQINHIQGNDRADRLLKNKLKKCIDKIDSIAEIGRLGGDEFAIILPNYTAQQATVIAEDIRQTFSQSSNKKVSFKFTFTASFAVTDTTLSGYQFFKLLIDTDKIVAELKSKGGNAVEKLVK